MRPLFCEVIRIGIIQSILGKNTLRAMALRERLSHELQAQD
jgi:hypothetical protein